MNVNLNQIFGSLDNQHKVINCLTTIDHVRNLMIDILPGGDKPADKNKEEKKRKKKEKKSDRMNYIHIL